MRIFGLIGYPLSHSFSKKYFAEKFEREAVTDAKYENFPIASISEFPLLLQQNPGIAGLNVTIPYKQQIIPYLNEQHPVVQSIQACNCIRFRNGKAEGFNTDVTGFEMTLRKFLKPIHDRALILGTGGAAKAVTYVLDHLHIPYYLISRNQNAENSRSLPYSALTDEIIHSHRLIINTTPLGMYPQVDVAPAIPYQAVTPDHYFYDLIYNPSKTLFLKMAEARGAVIQNGAEMLVIQAEESWRIWNER